MARIRVKTPHSIKTARNSPIILVSALLLSVDKTNRPPILDHQISYSHEAEK
jgi:hypothetical protein